MALNGEELHAHEKFKRERESYARPTKEQLEIAKLQDDLWEKHTANEELHEQINRVKFQLALYDSHQYSAGITIDNIRAVLR